MEFERGGVFIQLKQAGINICLDILGQIAAHLDGIVPEQNEHVAAQNRTQQ